MKAMRRDEKGFTLIELLIVIIILGILAVIGIPKFMNSKAIAIVKSCQTNRSSLEDAGERYFFDTNAYPTGAVGVCQDNLSATLAPSGVTGWDGPYIKANFVCPLDSAETYTFSSTNGAVSCENVDTTVGTNGVVTAPDLSKVATGKHALSISDK